MQLFDKAPKYDLRKEEISSLAGNVFGAGSDTLSPTFDTDNFCPACCAFPEKMPKVWEELDRIVGPHNSPSWDEEPELTQTKVFMEEAFRWRSVAIGGQSHTLVRNDEYSEYLITEQIRVQGNVRAFATIRDNSWIQIAF